ncbi:MAG: TrkA family potassium uptake protein [Planctomycetota bacterium]
MRSWRQRLGERLWVHINFLRVVVPQFKVSLLIFVLLNLVGALVIWSEGARERTFPAAVYTALALNFFEVADPYPQHGGVLIQAVYFLLPTLGLSVIAEGVVRLGVVIFNRKQLSPEWHMALAASFKNHVVVAGLGRIGLRVALRLQGDEHLVGIEAKPEGLNQLSENVAVLVGDATEVEMLEQANVRQARAILALTDNDLANLEIALNARELNPNIRVVLRMFNERLGHQLVERFGFDAVYSTSALAAPSFQAALYSNRILQTIELGSGHSVHLARFQIPARCALVGKTVIALEQDHGISVVLHHTAGRQDLLPSVDAHVGANDELYVLGRLRELEALGKLVDG